MKSFHPIVLAAVFARASTAAAATATANANEPQVLPPTAAIIESELAIAQTQSQLGSGTRRSDVRNAEEHGVLRKSDGGSSPGQGMLDKSGPGESPRWLRGDLDMFDLNMTLSGSGAGGSKAGKSKAGKAGSGAIAKRFPADGEELKAAVQDYVTQECAARNGTCFVAQQWGFPMNKWDVSQVTDMSGLFYDSQGLFEDFNEDITGWDTGSVTDMSFMFFEAREFNQNLADWNVEKVKDMALMFKDARSFNQNVSNWKFDDIERMTSMLDGAKSFEQNLCAWGEQPAVQLTLSSGNAKDIFRDSGCKLQVTPQDEDGPFCASCDDDGTDTNTTSFQFLLCRQVPERPGFGLEEFDARYSPSVKPVYSAMNLEVAEETQNNLMSDVKGYLDTTIAGTGLLGIIFPTMKTLSGALSAASPYLSILDFHLSKDEDKNAPDKATQKLIQDGFKQMGLEMKKLSTQVSAGFSRIRVDLADNALDNLMGYLQAMDFAYQEMQEALQLDETGTVLSSGIQTKKIYTDKYRAACNRPQFTPEDIFRQLYGFACGDNTVERSCDAGQGEDTGLCKFGVKKRQYMLDIYYEEQKNIVTNVKGFGQWLLQAMLLAQFHYGACLPADAATCNDPYTDPTRKKVSDDMELAFIETADNIARKIECGKRRFVDYLSGKIEDANNYYTDVVANRECFKVSSGTEKANCIAEQTMKALERDFDDKEWVVHVWNNPESKKDAVKSYCIPVENKAGCISSKEVNFTDIKGGSSWYFHLMYRYKSAPAFEYFKEYTLDGNHYPTVSDLIFYEGFVKTQDNGWCWGDPFDPVVSVEVIKKLGSGHGYFAVKKMLITHATYPGRTAIETYRFCSPDCNLPNTNADRSQCEKGEVLDFYHCWKRDESWCRDPEFQSKVDT